mgnify:CR=1 FL=1
MTPSAWLRYITGHFGPLPDSYFAFDVETSGLSLKNDVVLQLGWAMVDDRKLVDSGAVGGSVSRAGPGERGRGPVGIHAASARSGSSACWTGPSAGGRR